MPRHPCARDRRDDRPVVVRGVDHEHLAVVADEPDVVVDLQLLAVEGEDAAVTTWSMRPSRPPSQHHHRAQHLAALHLVERLLDVVERDGLGHELCRGRAGPAGTGRSSIGKSRLGRQSPYQRGFSAPPRPKNSIIGSSSCHVGVGHADLHDGAGQVAGVERLLVASSGWPTASMHTSAPLPPVSGLDAPRPRRPSPALTVWVAPNSLGPLELPVVEVDGDDRGGAGQPGPGDRGVAHAAAAEHGHRCRRGRRRRCCIAAPRPAITPQPSRPAAVGRAGGVDLGALAGGDERLLGEGADAERGRQLGAVGQRHLLGGVVGGEAVPRLALAARPALAAHRPPVEDHEVAGRHAR